MEYEQKLQQQQLETQMQQLKLEVLIEAAAAKGNVLICFEDGSGAPPKQQQTVLPTAAV